MDLTKLNAGECAEEIPVPLTEDQRQLLWHGLLEWGGPAYGTDALAQVIGFRDLEDLFRDGDRIRKRLAEDLPLSRFDWFRALAATEIVFASDTYGAACDWDIVTVFSDQESLTLLRQIQRKLLGVTGPVRAAISRSDPGRQRLRDNR